MLRSKRMFPAEVDLGLGRVRRMDAAGNQALGRVRARVYAAGKALCSRPVDLLHTNNTGCEESAVAARLAGIRRVLGTFHVGSTCDLHHVRGGLGIARWNV